MATTAITPDQDAIVCEIEIAAPPSRVFEAFTEETQVRQWSANDFCDLTDWAMDLRLGGAWRSTTKVRASGYEYIHHGKILEFDPPHLLVYTWYANFHEQPEKASVVRVELTPTATGTKLKLTHSGLAQEPKSRDAYSGGWPDVLQGVKKYVEG